MPAEPLWACCWQEPGLVNFEGIVRLTGTELDDQGSPRWEKQGEESGKAASGGDGGAEGVTRVFWRED